MQAWGFTARFAALANEYPELVPARVISQERGSWRVIHAGGEQSAQLSGRFRFDAVAEEYPTVGDFVMLEADDAGSPALIRALLPRKSVFLRRAAGDALRAQAVAANVDIAFICMSLNQNFNLRRLERYLAAAWESGATPAVLLTKADLCADTSQKRAEAAEVAAGVDVMCVSALEADGCDAVRAYLAPGRTIALIGSSGVGKSTLTNCLLGEAQLATGGIRGDGRGRHTTTRRELMLLPGGGCIIDTPGMRELGMWDAADGLERAFADIDALAQGCRFRNCSHNTEPGCAVRAAVAAGQLSAARLQSWRKLQAEYAHDQAGYQAARTQKFKAIAKINRSNPKK